MSDEIKNLTPQEQIAHKITEHLIEKKLVSANRRKKLKENIASGSMAIEDWDLLVDISAEQSSDGDNNA